MTAMIGWTRRPVPEPDDPPAIPWDDGSERERVVAWRRANLERAGLPYPLALQIAASRTDWHRVEHAMRRGATIEDVERIFL